MLLYPSSPFGRDSLLAVRRLQDEIDRAFAPLLAETAQATYPAVNMWQGENSIAITAEMPGVGADDIEISVKNDTLTLTGERKAPESGEKAAWHLRERPFGKFARTIRLPYRVDPDKVEAHFHDGVLEIEMQRPEEDLPRRIKVKAA